MSVEYKHDGKVELDDNRSIASIVLRKPTAEELRSCRPCRLLCIAGFLLILISLIVMSIVFIIISEKCTRRVRVTMPGDVVYEIAVESFVDSNSDGMGDLKGLSSKLEYIQSLGINTLLLNDLINDHDFDVNVNLGSVQDLSDFIEQTQARNMFVMASVNPAAISIDSPLFNNNVTVDWFLLRDINETTNWKTVTNKTAWFPLQSRNVSFYSFYGESQPMLNYNKPNVVNAFQEKLQLWLKRGLYGFLFESVSRLTVDDQFRSNNQTHFYDIDQSSTHDVLKEFYSTVANGDGVVWVNTAGGESMTYLGEVGNRESDRIISYTMAEIFSVVDVPALSHSISSQLAVLPKYGDLAWASGGSHIQRLTARFHSVDLAKLVGLFSLLLPGKVIWYFGEEKLMVDTNDKMVWDNQVVTGFARLAKLRTLRDEFSMSLKIISSNQTDSVNLVLLCYGNKLFVAANFGETNIDLNLMGKAVVLFSTNENVESQTIELNDFSLQPLQLLVMDIIND